MTHIDKAQRLWSRVNKSGPDDCWEWTGAKNQGYGLLTINYKSVMAHRLAWELHHNQMPPDGVQMRHTCGNRACCNPKHIELATGERRFWENVFKRSPNGCWEWTGARTEAGYGMLSVKGTYHLTHRYSWELATGQTLGSGDTVCHKCDNPACVNPAHFFISNQAGNMADAKQKGRMLHGEDHPDSKLTEDDVRKIHELSQTSIPRQEIANQLGVSRGTVTDVIHGRTWKHIKAPKPVNKSRGKNHPFSKLTADNVREIRRLSPDTSQRKLANLFNVSRGTIEAVIKGKTWKHIK